LFSTRISADVGRFHGPVYRSAACPFQNAQLIMSSTAIRPKYGTRWSSDSAYRL